MASAPAEPAGSRLAWLVHPLTPEEFVDRYWQAHPLHLTGWPDRFAGLFDLSGLRAALARQHETGLAVRVSLDHVGDDGGADRHVSIDAGEVASYLRRGASICVDPLDRAVPRLRSLATELKQDLNHAGPVSVKCYLSPDGFGFNMHFDCHVVTTLQIEGCKTWVVSRQPAIAAADQNGFLDSDGQVHVIGRRPSSLADWERPRLEDADLVEIHLEPGDVLCLPAGTWHSAKARGSSLALNVAFDAVDVLGLLTRAVAPVLRESPHWRAGLPVDASRARRTGEAPPSVTRRLEESVDELVRALGRQEVRQKLVRIWESAVLGDSLPGPVVAPLEPVAADVPVVDAGGRARLQCVLGVADAAAAARWYTRVLGCRVTAAVPEYGWVELSTPVPGVALGLTEDRGAAVAGGALLDLAVPDIDAMRRTLVEAGARLHGDVRTVSGLARFLRAEDPDGNALMFFSPEAGAHP